jgi:hypothetical protein
MKHKQSLLVSQNGVNSVEQIPHTKADNCLGIQDIDRLLWNPTFQYPIHSSQPRDLSQTIPVLILIAYFLRRPF